MVPSHCLVRRMGCPRFMFGLRDGDKEDNIVFKSVLR